jgi:hypothetical protein
MTDSPTASAHRAVGVGVHLADLGPQPQDVGALGAHRQIVVGVPHDEALLRPTRPVSRDRCQAGTKAARIQLYKAEVGPTSGPT